MRKIADGVSPGVSTKPWMESLRRRRASAYGAGQGLDDALAACRRLAGYGMASTVGYSAPAGESPRAVADVHLAAFDRLADEDLDCQVSLKLSALDFDPGLFDELVGAATTTGRTLHIDSLAPDTVDTTWRLLERGPPNGLLGATLPGRWLRSADDVAFLTRLGVGVRVVKGQWADDTLGPGIGAAEGFARVVDRLAGQAVSVAVATHDVPLLERSLGRLSQTGTPCSAELLFGLPFGAPMETAHRLGVPVRGYVPFGHRGATYGMRDVARSPAAARWLIEDLVLGGDKTWWGVRRSCRTR
jgi:proline dehydrogenase